LLCPAEINATLTTRKSRAFHYSKKRFSCTTSPAIALEASWKRKSMMH